ncbi:hypothetical protein [Pontibacter burrus]|uniref:DUF4595 domain-containing protein n=1 Tax=Pontibacter burrus TaxID=2704466 RepID=A0A6B3LX10_9BACT|nr:hypothetical protein [Pontibacter burrus]NEM98017.1 hypothetical protein [Pontibacter burrus]
MKLNFSSKLLSLFVAAALMFTACGDKDDDVNPVDNVSAACKLTSINSDGDVSNIEYNSKGYITKVTYAGNTSDYYLFVYDNSDRLVKEEGYSGGKLDNYVQYTYTNGKVSKAEWFLADGTADGYAEFKYDGSNRLIELSEIVEEDFDGEIEEVVYKQTFTYNAQGNVASSAISADGFALFTLTYENYDNKNTPMAAVKGLFDPWSGSSKNNPGKITQSFNMEGMEMTSTSTYAYIYNDKDFPTKSTETDEDQETTVTNYAYQCN